MFRPHMLGMRAEDLFAHMRATSSLLNSMSDKELIEALKKFFIEESEAADTSGDGGCAAGVALQPAELPRSPRRSPEVPTIVLPSSRAERG
jgi:hypothetical protein